MLSYLADGITISYCNWYFVLRLLRLIVEIWILKKKKKGDTFLETFKVAMNRNHKLDELRTRSRLGTFMHFTAPKEHVKGPQNLKRKVTMETLCEGTTVTTMKVN